MNGRSKWFGAVVLAGWIVAQPVGAASSVSSANPYPIREHEKLSRTFFVDKQYRSMKGPTHVMEFTLGKEGAESELLWVVGYRAIAVAEDGVTELPQELMCHSNLDIDGVRHAEIFGGEGHPNQRLFTLSQGQREIRFPEGFGVPVQSDEVFELTTQVLSLNYDGTPYKNRYRVTIYYVRDRDLDEPMTPLFSTAATGMVVLDGKDGYFNVQEPLVTEHGPGCLPGMSAGNRTITDVQGREFSAHWVIKPGREVNRTLVTNWLRLPYDTKVHYIAVHLHPFAESLELRDLTTDETVYKAYVKPSDRGIGIDFVDRFSSREGIELSKDHEYELISVYDNPTDEEHDSMAVMFLYLADREFARPPVSP